MTSLWSILPWVPNSTRSLSLDQSNGRHWLWELNTCISAITERLTMIHSKALLYGNFFNPPCLSFWTISKISGNGSTINIWTDLVLDRPPLGLDPSISPPKEHLLQAGVVLLGYISSWDRQGLWTRWKFEDTQAHFVSILDILKIKLSGCAPLAQSSVNRWGWKSSYSVKEGYSHLLFNEQNPSKCSMWNKIWRTNAIPKINFVCWLLSHKRILTTENLQKRGIVGPSRWPLCDKSEESISHLFLLCLFSRSVWSLDHGPLFLRTSWPSDLSSFFASWPNFMWAPKSSFKELWIALPKYFC